LETGRVLELPRSVWRSVRDDAVQWRQPLFYTKLYKIHTTSFARTGRSTCYCKQSVA